MSKADKVESSTEGAIEGSCRSTLSVTGGLSVFNETTNDAFSRADDSTIVAQELLGRRSRLAEEELLLSPCAGGLEWEGSRLLSTGWIAVGDEIWLDMAIAGMGFLSDHSFGFSGPATCSRIRTEGLKAVVAGKVIAERCVPRGDSKSAFKRANSETNYRV